jgi:very-short-patch-repair endonuclease
MPRIKRTITTTKRKQQSYDRRYKTNLFDWIDPFPLGFGTLPEKIVYNALTQAGIEFYYLNDVTFAKPEIDFLKTYQADFIIPSVKVIIEIQGSYWHSKPAAIEADAYKMAVYEAFGYKALAWWDFDIFNNLQDLLANSGILLTAPRVRPQLGKSTELTPLARTKTDTSQGIRTMNARKRKPYRTFIGAGKRTLRKSVNSYGK